MVHVLRCAAKFSRSLVARMHFFFFFFLVSYSFPFFWPNGLKVNFESDKGVPQFTFIYLVQLLSHEWKAGLPCLPFICSFVALSFSTSFHPFSLRPSFPLVAGSLAHFEFFRHSCPLLLFGKRENNAKQKEKNKRGRGNEIPGRD